MVLRLLMMSRTAAFSVALIVLFSCASAETTPTEWAVVELSPEATQLGHGAALGSFLDRVTSEDDWEYWENCDGTWESGYAWRLTGCQEPYYGAFAEGFMGPAGIQAIRVYLSTTPNDWNGQSTDFYVWGDAGGMPGNVLQIRPGIVFEEVGYYPEVSVHEVSIHALADNEPFYVGSWGDWPGAYHGYWVMADRNGPGGAPWTCISPDAGFPDGWQDPSIVWGTTRSMGYGVYVTRLPSSVEELPESPIDDQRTTWGQVKSLYKR